MDKELAQYINTLLAEKEREVEKEQVEYNSIYRTNPQNKSNFDAEKFTVWGQELSWERSIIYRCQKAIKFVEDIFFADCPLICIENPVGALTKHSKLGKASVYIQPYEFGHAEQKRTGLWLKGLPKLKGTKFIDVKGLPNKERHRLHWLPPSKDRWKIRSTTFQGIADAMADQWGGLV